MVIFEHGGYAQELDLSKAQVRGIPEGRSPLENMYFSFVFKNDIRFYSSFVFVGWTEYFLSILTSFLRMHSFSAGNRGLDSPDRCPLSSGPVSSDSM